MTRIAVTGLDGFTGRYLADILSVEGHETIGLVADVTDAAALDDEIARVRPEACIHLAGIAFAGGADFDNFYTVNQLGSFHLLDALARYVPGVRVILASTAQVYGRGAEGLASEALTPEPYNHYSLGKAAMERGARFWDDKLDIAIVRPFNYTGQGQEERYLIPKIVAHFRRREPLIELGNIDVERDFGDVRAVASAYAGLITCQSEHKVFNIATGVAHSIRAIIAMAEEITGYNIQTRINPQFVRPDEVARLAGDPARLISALPTWKPIELRETIRWMIEE